MEAVAPSSAFMPSPPVFPRPAPAPAPQEERPSALPEASPDSTALFATLISMSRWRAWQIVGGLSCPSKMPCYAWGIPATSCSVGKKLAEVPQSVCASCYALKGFFRTPKVRAAYQRRLERSSAPEWIDAMVKLVYWQAAETGEPYFRWFDSGDLIDVAMLRRIVAVARQTPEIRHWLPTREYAVVREYLRAETLPANLVLRISAPLVNGPAPQDFALPTSGVHTSEHEPHGTTCTANHSKPAHCGSCRACWQQDVEHVSYPLH